MEYTSPLLFLLIINSTFLIGLILNQNEISKDSLTSQNTKIQISPIEQITWISLILQLILLLIKIKSNTF